MNESIEQIEGTNKLIIYSSGQKSMVSTNTHDYTVIKKSEI